VVIVYLVVGDDYVHKLCMNVPYTLTLSDKASRSTAGDGGSSIHAYRG